MINAMELRRFSPRTQESYLAAVAGLAKHYRQPPDQLDATKIQAYLLHLTVERRLSWSSCNVAVSGLRFFYQQTLGWEGLRLPIPPRRKPSKLPEILSHQELERLFAAAHLAKHRALLMTTYAAGLRLSEVIALKRTDLDSQRQMIRVEQGKGRKDLEVAAQYENFCCEALKIEVRKRFSVEPKRAVNIVGSSDKGLSGVMG
jgi:site-specific recombinase XerD